MFEARGGIPSRILHYAFPFSYPSNLLSCRNRNQGKNRAGEPNTS